MTYREIARELGVSPARAQQVVREAVLRFARCWTAAYPGEPSPLVRAPLRAVASPPRVRGRRAR